MKTRPKITVIGDSTVDNKVWVKDKGKSAKPMEFTSDCKSLLANINSVLNDPYSTLTNNLKNAAEHLSKEAYSLLINSDDDNNSSSTMQDLETSLQATLNVLKSPTDTVAIDTLQNTAKTIAPGKPTMWKLYLSAITAVVGAALFALGVAFIAPTGGISAVGALAGGGLMIAATALFFSGRQSGVSREMNHLHVAAKTGLTT